MKSAFKGISFWIGQKDIEAQLSIKKAMQLRQRCEQMQTKFAEKLEQLHGAYQKAVKKIHSVEQELDNVSKDKAELQEKYAEKSRYSSALTFSRSRKSGTPHFLARFSQVVHEFSCIGVNDVA